MKAPHVFMHFSTSHCRALPSPSACTIGKVLFFTSTLKSSLERPSAQAGDWLHPEKKSRRNPGHAANSGSTTRARAYVEQASRGIGVGSPRTICQKRGACSPRSEALISILSGGLVCRCPRSGWQPSSPRPCALRSPLSTLRRCSSQTASRHFGFATSSSQERPSQKDQSLQCVYRQLAIHPGLLHPCISAIGLTK